MKLTKYILASLSFASVMAFTACEDFLKEEPYSLRFPFLFRYWRQIWPVLVLARRSQVPSRWHRDGGKC